MCDLGTKDNILLRFYKGLTRYERWYLLLAVLLTCSFAVLFPEEDVNGVHGNVILLLGVLYTALNVVCELLIAKQSRWNFPVSWGIEVVEIIMYSILGYRFATMLTTIFFWIPVDTVSFIVWSKHPDRADREKTKVRKLTGWQRVLIIIGIFAWTFALGSLIVKWTDGLAEVTDIFNADERRLAIIVCYLDAMVSALDICNGTFILLRIQEQWIAWYLEVIFDAICVIIGGQYVMLALTVCYLTNTTYGYIKWGRYIDEHGNEG